MEVENQTHSPSGHPEIGKKLGFVDGQHIFDTLKLKNQFILNDYVQTVATIEIYALVADRKRHLSLECDTAEMQLVTKALFVG